MHDRDPFDPLCLHQLSDLAEGGQLLNADNLPGHNVLYPPGVRLDVFLGEPGICRKQLAPSRALALGPSLHPTQQVTFSDDPDELPVSVEDGNPADA
jgi:hypothetical protein